MEMGTFDWRLAAVAALALLLAGCGNSIPATVPAAGDSPDAPAPPAQPPAGIVTERGYLTMDDGVQLQYFVQRPDGPGPYPAILTYNGYDAGSNTASSAQTTLRDKLLPDGFAFVGVNVRGSGCSGGTFILFDPKWAADGYAVVEWIASQPWSNGRVGMYGVSFPGITQWMVAGMHPPHLASVMPASTVASAYYDAGYPGGIRNVSFPAFFLAIQNAEAAMNLGAALQAGDALCLQHFLASTAQNPPDSVILLTLQHPYEDELDRTNSPGRFLQQAQVPVFAFSTWQDEQVAARVTRSFGALDPATSWIIASNGSHGFPAICTVCLEQQEQFLRWTLLGEDNGFERTPHVQLFLETAMVTEVSPPGATNTAQKSWSLDFPSWAATEPAPMALHLRSSGRLSPEAPAAGEAPDSYPYPLPSASSNPTAWTVPSQVPLSDPWQASVAGPGALLYTSEPFEADRVLFKASADLWLSSTATDTDLQVTLTEIRPDGQETYIQRGWLRASHRRLDEARSTVLEPWQTHDEADAEPLVPGEPAFLRVEIFPFAHPVRRGSRLRLIIDAPTGITGLWSFGFVATPAINTILHDAEHPSQLVAGVLPIPAGIEVPPLPACGTLFNQECRPAIP